jgi:hypothetical protein
MDVTSGRARAICWCLADSFCKKQRGLVEAKPLMCRLQVVCSVLVGPWIIVELRVEMQRVRLGGSGRRSRCPTSSLFSLPAAKNTGDEFSLTTLANNGFQLFDLLQFAYRSIDQALASCCCRLPVRFQHSTYTLRKTQCYRVP